MYNSIATPFIGLLRPPLYATLPVAAGAFMGWISWISGLPALFFSLSVITLAWIWAIVPGRLQAFLLFFGYFLAGASDTPAAADAFFGKGIAVSVALWVTHAAILALPFGLLHGARWKPLRFSLALVLVSIPPIGILGWLSPLLAAGAVFPGVGLAGYAGMIILLALAAWVPSINTKPAKRGFVVGSLAMVFVADVISAGQPQPDDWFGQNTSMGEYPEDVFEQIAHHKALRSMSTESIEAGAKLVLLPEGIAGMWSPVMGAVWSGVAQLAEENGATVLIGASTSESGGGTRMNSIVAIGADTFQTHARMPMPVSLWKPWSDESYASNMFSSGLVMVQGREAATSICYEDMLVWPLVWSFAAGDPVAILSSGNNWFGNASASRIQRISVELQARLYGVPLIRAVNQASL